MNTLINNIKDNYTRVPNEIVNDKRLTWKARGIFLYLMSKPDDWQFYVDEIGQWATDGKTALNTGLKELEEFGYLLRKKRIDEQRKFAGWLWIIKLPDNTVSRQAENPTVGNNDIRETPVYNKTDSNKTELSKTDIDIYIHRFEEFWDLYDKKLERRKCESKWKKLSSDDKESIMQFIPIYKQSVSSKQYLKHPFTFLNSRIWEDDWNNYKAHETHQPTNEPTRTDTFAQRGEELLNALQEQQQHPDRYNSWQLEGKRTDPYSTS